MRFRCMFTLIMFALVSAAPAFALEDTAAEKRGAAGILGVSVDGAVYFTESRTGGGGPVLCTLTSDTEFEFPQLPPEPLDKQLLERYFRGFAGQRMLIYANTTWNGVEREGRVDYCDRLVVYELDR